jgi:hypothetical protein
LQPLDLLNYLQGTTNFCIDGQVSVGKGHIEGW